MDYLTNPFVLALIMGALSFGITYIYLRKTLDEDDRDGPDMMTCAKVAGVSALCTLLGTGYLNFAYGEKEQATLTTEYFEIGQPPF